MRYAIYATPAAGSALEIAGSGWLGRSAYTDGSHMMPEVSHVAPDIMIALTKSPRRYGFHGTLRAPFHLADGVGERDLIHAASRFASDEAPVSLPGGLIIGDLRGFLALVPGGDPSDINLFAARSVEWFEAFRAPLSEADVARRRASQLSPAQDALLLKWGYPYVFDEFSFHMTLTERVHDAETRAHIQKAAQVYFADALIETRKISHIAVFKEFEPGGAFQILADFELTGHPVSIHPMSDVVG